jgi:hypothetical protein
MHTCRHSRRPADRGDAGSPDGETLGGIEEEKNMTVLDLIVADLERLHAVGLISKDSECSCTMEEELGEHCEHCGIYSFPIDCRPARRVPTTEADRRKTNARSKLEEMK